MKNASSLTKEEMRLTASLYEGKKRTRKIPGHLFQNTWEAEEDYKLTVSELRNEIDRFGYVRRLG